MHSARQISINILFSPTTTNAALTIDLKIECVVFQRNLQTGSRESEVIEHK